MHGHSSPCILVMNSNYLADKCRECAC